MLHNLQLFVQYPSIFSIFFCLSKFSNVSPCSLLLPHRDRHKFQFPLDCCRTIAHRRYLVVFVRFPPEGHEVGRVCVFVSCTPGYHHTQHRVHGIESKQWLISRFAPGLVEHLKFCRGVMPELVTS